MKRTRRHGNSDDRAPPPESGSRELLQRTARILVECGFQPNQLVREFESACSQLKTTNHEWSPTTLSYFHDLPHVLTYWHRDPDYVDDRGNPRPLSLVDEGPSLSKLIARVSPSADPIEVVETLLRIKAIRRVRNKYIPNDQSALLEGEALRVHAFLAILALLRTMDHNIQQKLSGGSRIFERTVIGIRFPIRQLPEFLSEVKRRGDQSAKEIDALLLRSEVPPDSSEPFTRVTYASFVGHDALSAAPTAPAPSILKRPERRGPGSAPERGRGRKT